MTRRLVLQEGVRHGDGRFVEVGALTPAEEWIPVTFGEAIVGIATDFQRDEETGGLSFDLMIHTALHTDLENYETVITASHLTSKYVGEGESRQLIISKGTIREVRLFISGANPGAKIKES